MQALRLVRIQARANRLMNHRLHSAMAALTHEELHAPRTSFFPTLIGTLNHILAVDLYYVAALEGPAVAGDAEAAYRAFRAAEPGDLATVAAMQAAVDARLVAFCDGLPDDAALDRVIEMPRGGGRVQRDRAGHVLAHLHMHQVHHRGQAHAMLSGTRVAPPQLDEFLMPSEGHLRTADMAALGWVEDEVYGAPPA